jgi:hypothetical protein
MDNVITESGMNFVAENVFHIEKSPAYSSIGLGIKSVEFIRIVDNSLLFVEAKESFPNPENPRPENPQRFEEAINEIIDKFIHSLNLYSALKVGVRDDDLSSLPAISGKVILKFILVIKSHKPDWCKPVKQKLLATFPPYFNKIWKPEVLVITHDAAMKYKIACVGSGSKTGGTHVQ